MNDIILASSSQARQILMRRLALPFNVIPSDIPEILGPDESHADFVRRLSEEKAKAVAASHPHALCIGSDAIASLNGQILGKPLNHETAIKQLQAMSGHRVDFLTGVCVYQESSKRILTDLVVTHVYFKKLSLEKIEFYLTQAKPYHSAGSLHSEGLGIILMEKWEGTDPTALMGLPLIKLTDFLEEFGVAFTESKAITS